MTDKDLIDLFLNAELTDAERAQLDAEIEKNPELLHEIVDEQQIDLALRVLMGDETADQQVAVSVLSVLRGAPIDDFKSRLMADVKAVEQQKQKDEAAVRVPPQVEAEEAVQPAPTPARSAAPRRSGWSWGLPIGAAAAAAVLISVLMNRTETLDAGKSRAFLLSATPDVRVQRGNSSFAASVDMTLEPGDRITTGEGGAAKIGFADDPTRVDLKAQAQLHFTRGGKAKRLELLKGEIAAAVPPQTEGEPLLVTTLHAELRVREAEFRLLDGADFSRLEVRKGSADFTRRSDGRRISVEAAHFAVAGRDVEFAARLLGPSAAPGASPSAIAVVRRVQGDAFVFNQSPAERLPLKAGQPVLEDQGIVTEGTRSLVVLDYSDTTRLEVGGDTVLRRLSDLKDKTLKRVALEAGSVVADVTKQPAGRPMILVTAHADARVLGTRFQLSVEAGQTRLQVEEGAVQFTQSRERESIVVRSGYYAVAAPGRPFEAIPVPGAVTYLAIDPASGVSDGDGEWSVENRSVRQGKVSRRSDGPSGSPASSLMYKVEEGGSVLLEATAEVNQVTPDVSQGLGAWGFGLAASFRNQNVILRSVQGGEGGSVFEFKDVKSIPFEHGREGTYRLKLRLERRPDQRAILRGKLWQGDREPDGWMIEDELALDGAMTHVGFQTVRCACTFTSFRVRVLKEEPR